MPVAERQKRQAIGHGQSPRWTTMKMVEDTIQKAIKKHPTGLTAYQLWRMLPKGIQYWRLQGILEILAEEGKIRLECRNEGRRQKEVIVWEPVPFTGKRPEQEIRA